MTPEDRHYFIARFGAIKTDYWQKPIPIRTCDWSAWFDGNEELGSGHGLTEEEAVADLLEWATLHDDRP